MAEVVDHDPRAGELTTGSAPGVVDNGEVFNLTTTHATNELGASASALPPMAQDDDMASAGGGSPAQQGRSKARTDKVNVAARFDHVLQEQLSKARVSVEEGKEEHWNHVMKKLAPQGYGRGPVWQKHIIERVLKRMTTRTAETVTKPLTEKQSMSPTDLALTALSPDISYPLKTSLAPRKEETVPRAANAVQASLRRKITQRHNKVHFYTRGIQMEQLLGQDLDTDLRHMHEEVHLTLRESKGGEMRAAEELVKAGRKEKAVANRLQVLVEKANALEASNRDLIASINDLRSERALVLNQVKRMKEKDAKMEEDMTFLANAAHSALDQREKVKVKLMQTQRDSAFEKGHKLNQLADLMAKADVLDAEYERKLAAIDEHEQARKRRAYALGKQKRQAQLQAETRAGFLQSQVVGWDSEFARLQEFTGMDKRFAPGDDQTIEEITSRYLSKDQQNTSLLRYLHAQQMEVQNLEGEIKSVQDQARALETQLQHAIESDSAPVMDYDGLAQKEAEAAYRIEAQLAELCDKTNAVTNLLAPRADMPTPAHCSVANLEEHLQLHEDVTAKLQAHWRHRYTNTKVRTQDKLWEWVQVKPPRQYESINEIHERLLINQQNLVQLGADEDDEELERRQEKQSHYTPFTRRKVNKAKERAQIHEWARRRQPAPGGGLAQGSNMSGSNSGAMASTLPPAMGRTNSGGMAAGSGAAAAHAASANRKPTSAPGQGGPSRLPPPGGEGTMVYVIGGQ
eukprot:CAMPEP_0185177222 /NCGR_PEP_ID=MMETSP1139-20130426/29431_1 /TAXON_ID=298111 /ORGANISM="Pavlova sp., Strain CCMP459" /LENGTH=743 /DNA_ID=CAMNT_0027743013 /DNA_START=46 /DNA_END=2277 /DNA_ORIENTATION=-